MSASQTVAQKASRSHACSSSSAGIEPYEQVHEEPSKDLSSPSSADIAIPKELLDRLNLLDKNNKKRKELRSKLIQVSRFSRFFSDREGKSISPKMLKENINKLIESHELLQNLDSLKDYQKHNESLNKQIKYLKMFRDDRSKANAGKFDEMIDENFKQVVREHDEKSENQTATDRTGHIQRLFRQRLHELITRKNSLAERIDEEYLPNLMKELFNKLPRFEDELKNEETEQWEQYQKELIALKVCYTKLCEVHGFEGVQAQLKKLKPTAALSQVLLINDIAGYKLDTTVELSDESSSKSQLQFITKQIFFSDATPTDDSSSKYAPLLLAYSYLLASEIHYSFEVKIPGETNYQEFDGIDEDGRIIERKSNYGTGSGQCQTVFFQTTVNRKYDFFKKVAKLEYVFTEKDFRGDFPGIEVILPEGRQDLADKIDPSRIESMQKACIKLICKALNKKEICFVLNGKPDEFSVAGVHFNPDLIKRIKLIVSEIGNGDESVVRVKLSELVGQLAITCSSDIVGTIGTTRLVHSIDDHRYGGEQSEPSSSLVRGLLSRSTGGWF